MQHKLKRFISVLLLAVTVFNGTALTNYAAYADDMPSSVNGAINSFVEAVGQFASKSLADEIGKVANFCSRLGGLTSVASGVIGILQMIGIIKDPTQEKLKEILNAVKDVQTELTNMDAKLDQIAQDLINIQTAQQEIARNTKATMMSTNWNNFNTNYTERLSSYLAQYQTYINAGIKEWWEQASHKEVYVLMTKMIVGTFC